MFNITFDCDPSQKAPNQKGILEILEKVLSINKIKNAEISYIFGDDQLLLELKNKFFKKNHFTDVIAFRLNNYEESIVEGEVYISLPRAKENAKLFNQPYEKEVARLIIHGCLHLIGYSDSTNKEKHKMTELENNILKKVNWLKLFNENE
ncbi:MAG: rRNA maturation RNase YbeY [Candidatus Marinimicrobia bacterium]|nr:rRNA maturation RNase YbeY [Candidatus Neomarinimicrobiota bacterium]|tara:strand:+ start:3084 stop:3533 length:450 start_codon:yes stop_codon:yes gene_type:complete